jgi:hypothetical protein
MPDTVAVQYSHNYVGTSATNAMGDVGKFAQIGGGSLAAAGSEALDAIKTLSKNVFGSGGQQFNRAGTAEAVSTLAQDAGAVGPGFTDLALKSMGKAVNPHTEMIFNATDTREYQFEFHFVPRSQAETIDIYNIIKTFKAYAAPEVSDDAGGRYWIPPAQFDIKFYFKNEENPVVAKISTCVLKMINVNYSAAGQWATFADGAPVHIQLQLTFGETDIIVRQLIEKYGY